MGALGNTIQDLLTSNPHRSAWLSRRMPEGLAEKMGRRKVLGLFAEASRTVPAYRRFLESHGVDPRAIKDFEGFRSLPLIDKHNYLVPNRGRSEDFCAGGNVSAFHTVSRSSGSSGEPIYLPRNARQEVITGRGLESMWVAFWDIHRRTTLLLVCYDMGMWVAGEMSADLSREMAKKHPGMTVATPGSDIAETLAVIRDLAHGYQQTIILGYPPFLRQLIVRGEEEGIVWKDLHVRLFPTGEGYSELWRSRVLEHLGAEDNLRTVCGAFGSSEGLLVGLETPFSILVRQLASRDEALRRDIYGTSDDCDSLVQHSPMGLFIEIVDSEMIITSSGAAPLIRYNTHDRGGSAPFAHVMDSLARHGYGADEFREAGLDERHIWRMPFLYSFGRRDCVSVDGANIFVEGVAPALLKAGMQAVGNWKIAVRERPDGRLQFAILVEHAKGAVLDGDGGDKERRSHYQRVFLDQLVESNLDFRSAHRNNPDCLTPEVIMYEHGQGPFREDGSKVKQQHVYKGDL
jgi:phenylacetate-CoA ligase